MDGKHQVGISTSELRRQVRETFNTERSRMRNIVNGVMRDYPASVFSDTSNSPDACAARGARVACVRILEAIEQLPDCEV